MTLYVCQECEAVHRAGPLEAGGVALCLHCDAVLARHYRVDVDHSLALSLAAAILFVIANVNPILAIDVNGIQTEVNIWDAAFSLANGWISTAAVGLALTTFFIPAVQIVALLWVLVFARFGRRAPAFTFTLLLLKELRPWSMTEVFLLGALVAIVKLSHWVPISGGIGIWSLAGLAVVITWLGRLDPRYWWELGNGENS